MKIADLFAELGIKPDMAALRAVDKYLGAAEKKTKGFGITARKILGAAFSPLGAIATGAAVTGVIKDALAFDEGLTSLKIDARGAAGSLEDMRGQILKVSKETGVAKEQILAATTQFVALTGRGDQAAEAMNTFARVAKASGANMDDVSTAAAAMTQQFGIGAPEFEKAFSVLISGGKSGAVNLRDMAGLLAELAPAMKSFSGGGGVEGMAQLSASLQTVMKGAGSAPEAATKLKRLMDAFSSPRTIKALEKYGVKLFTKEMVDGRLITRQKNLLDIFTDMGKADIIADPRKLNEVFESSEAKAAAREILNMGEGVRDLTNETLKANDVAQDYAENQASSSAKAAKAWNALKVTIADSMTPERIEKFTNALVGVLGVAEKLIGVFESVSRFMDKIGESAEERKVGEDAMKSVIARGGSIEEGIAARKASKDALRGVQKQQFLGNLGLLQGMAGERRREMESANNPIITPEFRMDLTIQGPLSGDPQEIAMKVRAETQKFWDSRMRELSASTGQ